MNTAGDVEETLDLRNEEFISKARQPLRDLSQYSTESLGG